MRQIPININDPPKILKLRDQEVLDYIKCPNYFYLKYMSKIPLDNFETYKSLVDQVITAYMYNLMNGKVMSYKAMKKMWDNLADENPTILTDKKVLDGFGLINQVDRYCYDNKVIIADIDSPYQINFKGNIILTGKIGIIRYNGDKLELFIVDTSQKQPDPFLLDMSLKYTMQLYGIKETSGYQLDGIHVYHVKSGREFYSMRSQKDFDRLKSLMENVGFAIRNEVFYPREDYLCSTCKFKVYCGYT